MGISWEFGSLYIHTLYSSIYFAIGLVYLALIRASASCTVHIVISWKLMDLHIRCFAFKVYIFAFMLNFSHLYKGSTLVGN